MSDRDKLAKTGGTQPVMGTDPNAPNPPVWPATSEASGQQWGAGYAPQVIYNLRDLAALYFSLVY